MKWNGWLVCLLSTYYVHRYWTNAFILHCEYREWGISFFLISILFPLWMKSILFPLWMNNVHIIDGNIYMLISNYNYWIHWYVARDACLLSRRALPHWVLHDEVFPVSHCCRRLVHGSPYPGQKAPLDHNPASSLRIHRDASQVS